MSRPRITGGRLRGRPLPVAIPRAARPTSSRVREALFSIVGHDLGGLRVLDAFGGSGLVALEAWSRGAEVVVVERDRAAADAIRANARALGAALEVRTGDVARVIGGLGRFSIVFADPPYADDPVRVLDLLSPATDRLLVLESDATAPVPAQAGPLALDRTRTYGGTALHVYRVAEDVVR